jgi:peptidoglycan/xylan/chitin deacetylase (PgdA/CDA1 family)
MPGALPSNGGPARDRPGRRARLATLASRLGVLAMLERLPRRPCLVVINYHRIGNAKTTALDNGVVEATPDEFALQMSWLKRNFHVATLEEAQRFVERPSKLRYPIFLITFDDGYRDNYDVAFPILKSLSLSATFFLITKFVGSRTLPWWDRIADLVRRRRTGPIDLAYPWPVRVDADSEKAIPRLLALYKNPATSDRARFLSELEIGCGVSSQVQADERLFLDWTEARQMLAAGMSFGSHTHSHELLARQSESEQRRELQDSRGIITSNLGVPCDALAYPVGSQESFSPITMRLLEGAGYRTAFSYYGGVNVPFRMERFNVLRIPTDPLLGLPGYHLRALLSSRLTTSWPM